jgi:FemAB-related protein (PEP-CTERM system-associated)
MLRVAEWTGSGDAWDRFVQAHPGAGTVMHLFGWKAALERSYGHPTHYLAAWEGEELRGVLPLALIKGPLLRPSLVSMPYMDYGGPCVRPGDTEAEAALVQEAVATAKRHGAFLTLRDLREGPPGLPCSLDKLTVLLQLGTSEEALWKKLPSERRNRIRKGQKAGLVATFPGAEGLRDFYRVFATNMRDLGSPVHSLAFFARVIEELKDRAQLIVVKSGDEPVGAGMMLFHEGMISMPWVSSLRAHFAKCPNQVLYWEVMRYGLTHGHRVMDFGRSSRDSGTFEAKRQWGGEAVQLYWHYYPTDAVPPGDDVKKLGWAARVWQRLPMGLANTVGPWIRRGLPN